MTTYSTSRSPSPDATECRRASQSVALLLTGIGVLRWWLSSSLDPAWPLFVAALAVLTVGVAFPSVLVVPTQIWNGLLGILGFLQSNLFFGLIYFAVVTPMGVWRKRKDRLAIRSFDSGASTWVDRAGGLNDQRRLY